MLEQATTTSSANPIEIAQAMAARGFTPIPLHVVGPDGRTCSCSKGANCGRSAGKHPIQSKWQAGAQGVAAFEEVLRKRKRVNFGIATGAASGIFVLDIDPDPEKDGFASMKRLVAEHGPMPRTYIVKTGSGGYHYYFKLPAGGLTNRNKPLVTAGYVGLDIRGDGGQVVAPPSVSWKGPYAVQVDAPIADAPDWLLDMLRPEAPPVIGAQGRPMCAGIHNVTTILGVTTCRYCGATHDGAQWTPAEPNRPEPQAIMCGGEPTAHDLQAVKEFGEFLEGAGPAPSAAQVFPEQHAPAPVPTPAAPRQQTQREEAYERSIVKGELARVAGLVSAGWQQPWDITTFEAACQLVELANADWSAITLDEAHQQFIEHCPPAEPGYQPEEKWISALTRVGNKRRPMPAERPPLDDFFTSGGVTPAPDPTAAAGADREGAPAATAAPAYTAAINPDDFFHPKDGLLASKLAYAIVQQGPIRWGQNKRWWTYDVASGVWVENPEAVINRTIDLLGDRFRGAHATNAEAVVRRHVPELLLDQPNSTLMNFTNGMLDWRTGEMRPHAPEFLSTVQFPVPYDPTATCPNFEGFLDSVMSPAYQKLAWEMLGYLLYSGNPLQKAFLFHGTGGNGKGTLMRVIQAMLGDRNTSAQSLDALNGSRFAPAHLFGKIANLAGDIDGTFQESTATFKMLTGEDRFSGEYKYGDSFGFMCWAVPVFSANKIPGSADVSVGYLRRWVVLEFDRTFTGAPILGLSDMLIAELPGIVAKAMTYLAPLLQRKAFDVSAEAKMGEERFAMAMDQVRQWVDEWCFPAPGTTIGRDILYARYTTWATANGAGKLRASEFYTRLEAAGFPAKKIKGHRVFADIGVIEPDRRNQPEEQDENDEFFARGA